MHRCLTPPAYMLNTTSINVCSPPRSPEILDDSASACSCTQVPAAKKGTHTDTLCANEREHTLAHCVLMPNSVQGTHACTVCSCPTAQGAQSRHACSHTPSVLTHAASAHTCRVGRMQSLLMHAVGAHICRVGEREESEDNKGGSTGGLPAPLHATAQGVFCAQSDLRAKLRKHSRYAFV